MAPSHAVRLVVSRKSWSGNAYEEFTINATVSEGDGSRMAVLYRVLTQWLSAAENMLAKKYPDHLRVDFNLRFEYQPAPVSASSHFVPVHELEPVVQKWFAELEWPEMIPHARGADGPPTFWIVRKGRVATDEEVKEWVGKTLVFGGR